MELYKEILLNLLSEYKVEVSFGNTEINASEIIEGKCYKTLCEIKEIIHDISLDDCECVEKIEQINIEA